MRTDAAERAGDHSTGTQSRRRFFENLGGAAGILSGVAVSVSETAQAMPNPFARSSSRPKCAGIPFFRAARSASNHNSNRRYLLIHGDEGTAREVLRGHMEPGGGGRGIAYLIDNANRNIRFRGGQLDPNRMFSNEGAERNLQLLNPGWRLSQVLNGVAYLGRKRHELVNRLIPPPGGLILALHNNQRGYNVRTEVPISDAAALQDPEHPEDFALVTDPADFAILRQGRYNVVLQVRPKGAEDGSLSRLAVRLGVRYVNLEAGLGNTAKQRDMLRWVEESLS